MPTEESDEPLGSGVTVFQRSKSVWVVQGEIDGRSLQIKGSSRSLALLRWNETKTMLKRARAR